MANQTNPDWMISDVVDVPGVQHVVVLSADGLVRACSPDLDRAEADKLAAAASGLLSLGSSLARRFGGATTALRQQMTEWDGGFLFVRGAGDGSCLAVVTDDSIDPALIASQMVLQVKRFGEHLITLPRE